MKNTKFFDHPPEKELAAKLYVLLSYVTKIILQISQKTNVKSVFVNQIFYEERGKCIMNKVIDIIERLVNGEKVDGVLKSAKEEDGDQVEESSVSVHSEDGKVENVIVEEEGEKKVKDYEKFIISEVLKFLKVNADYYDIYESCRPSRTRSESQFDRQDVVVWMRKYVDILWKGIDERLKYFDKDGSTCCSEAPAEGIFSILAYITENRASLTPSHLSKLCRVIKEGPTPGTLKAAALTKRALGKWPSEHGSRFTTNSYMPGMTSSTVADVRKKSD